MAAAEVLARHTQAGFNQMVVRLELENEIPEDTGMSVQKKCARLARILAQDAEREVETLEGPATLGEAVVEEAVALAEEGSPWGPQAVLEQALAREAYALRWEAGAGSGRARASLVPALPPELETENGEDEVRGLLKARGFGVSLGHLDQALNAHGRGDWAAANGQLRTFLEGLMTEIAVDIGIADAGMLPAENRLRKLAKAGFLSSERGEWVGDGKGFINGLMKMFHTEGAHPGLSDADHCTFRLDLALVTTRSLLRRLEALGRRS